MQVGSYLELFTTLFGWQFYDRLWDILTGTGLAFLPFLGIILNNVLETHVRGATEGPVSSLRRMDVEIAVALTVVVLAGQPTVTLSAASLSYVVPVTVANPAPCTATVASPCGTTYGSSGFTGAPGTAGVPIWWYGVIAVSSGFNSAAKSLMPSVADFRGFEAMARTASIKNPVLRQETNDFFTQCYIPAQSKYLAEKPASAAITTLLSNYGNDDPKWMGSQVYLATPGYYDTRAAQQVQGFPYSAGRDTEYATTVPPPTWGKPTCSEWWTGAGSSTGIGLKQKLLAEGGPLDSVAALFTGGFSSVKRQDAVVKMVLSGSPPAISESGYATANSVSGGGIMRLGETLLKDVFTSLGLALASIGQAIMMAIVLKGLPMIQAVILMGMYALLPLIVVISGYSLEMMLIGTMAIFTVKFWTFLWEIARWVDQNMIASLYPGGQSFLGWVQTNTGDWAIDAVDKRMILDLITTALYLGLPVLWTAMMAWVGYRVLSGASELMQPLQKAGQTRGRWSR
ncbi:MAG: conjugal transfer protein TraG N-terminal domain-containing protein [Gammaproteobacteria bacterium]|nr:conjugal transfer protein TraG N-terminal domain-containing protein [Gammaproteobacteria bacterium]